MISSERIAQLKENLLTTWYSLTYFTRESFECRQIGFK